MLLSAVEIGINYLSIHDLSSKQPSKQALIFSYFFFYFAVFAVCVLFFLNFIFYPAVISCF